MLWTGLRRVLTLKLTGGIPWLVIVPILASVVEFSNWLGFAQRLPHSFVLMFGVGAAIAAAAIVYAMACPPSLKEIGSQDEWSEATSRRRQAILRGLEQDKALKAALLSEVERRIDESLAHAFSLEQIVVIKRELIVGVEGNANFLGESLASVAETSVAAFNQLNSKNAVARWICTALIVTCFALLFAVFFLRVVSVYHAAIG
jgi:hypothetical protein